jgi:hypothetical protein
LYRGKLQIGDTIAGVPVSRRLQGQTQEFNRLELYTGLLLTFVPEGEEEVFTLRLMSHENRIGVLQMVVE